MYAVNVTSPVQLPLVSGCWNSGVILGGWDSNQENAFFHLKNAPWHPENNSLNQERLTFTYNLKKGR